MRKQAFCKCENKGADREEKMGCTPTVVQGLTISEIESLSIPYPWRKAELAFLMHNAYATFVFSHGAAQFYC